MKNLITKSVILVLSFLPVFITGCLIREVNQPATVETGKTFTASLIVSEMTAESSTPHKGILGVMVPEDWEFESGEYVSDVGTGLMELNLDENPVYGDMDTIIPPPIGMKWVDLISDTGYLHDADVFHEVTVNFTVGQTEGDFLINYFVTKNTADMLKSINPEDTTDNTSAWADTSLNHPVQVKKTVGVEDEKTLPTQFNLKQNYPNPFNPNTTISYSIPIQTNVNISVYDVSGKEIAILVNEVKSPGSYNINFSAKNLPSGVYYYKITTNEYTETRKMVLLK